MDTLKNQVQGSKMADTPVNPDADNNSYMPQKKDVVFETVKSTFLGIGMCVVSAAIADCVYNSWSAKALKLPVPENVSKLFTGKITALFVAASAVVGFTNARRHNREVKKFTERRESEKLAGNATDRSRN